MTGTPYFVVSIQLRGTDETVMVVPTDYPEPLERFAERCGFLAVVRRADSMTAAMAWMHKNRRTA